MALEDEQVAAICVENEAMVQRLNGVYARQQAALYALGDPSLKSLERLTAHVRKTQPKPLA